MSTLAMMFFDAKREFEYREAFRTGENWWWMRELRRCASELIARGCK